MLALWQLFKVSELLQPVFRKCDLWWTITKICSHFAIHSFNPCLFLRQTYKMWNVLAVNFQNLCSFSAFNDLYFSELVISSSLFFLCILLAHDEPSACLNGCVFRVASISIFQNSLTLELTCSSWMNLSMLT